MAIDSTDESRRQREDRAARVAAVAFLGAIVAGLTLVGVYVAGGLVWLEGLLLAIAFGGVGTGLGVWAVVLLKEPVVTEDRYPMRSTELDRETFERTFEASLEELQVPRRRFLVRLLAGAGASLLLALILPFRSLGPGPEGELFFTNWRSGVRLVTSEGEPLRPEDVVADQVVTVFPEGISGEANLAQSQAVLIGLGPGVLELPAGAPETVADLVVYSKVCTHAGCPVGLFRAGVNELLCPCHQSTFDVRRGGGVLSGPAGRGLPQLPIGIDEDGFLIALGDFPEPIGPSFWDMTKRPRR